MRKNSISNIDKRQANVILALAASSNSSRSSSISSTYSVESTASSAPEKTRWSCHKDVLISSSKYFNSIFNTKFQEAEASIVFLPRNIFTSSVLDDVLYFMYTKKTTSSRRTTDDVSESRNLEILDQLESMYMAADYLGIEELCLAIKEELIQLTHGLNCYCSSCTVLIPQLLYFTGPNQHNDPILTKLTHSILKLLINDPEKNLPSFWSSASLHCLFSQTIEMESLHGYLQDRLLEHVNKNNAIETLHGCFLSQDRVLDHDWSQLLFTQKRIKQVASKLLADHFDFYCTKYPKLLSCVDGVTYSFDFLEFLLSSVLDLQMNASNACLLYKGIVRNLMCRDNVQRTPSVKFILKNAKDKTIRYIATHLNTMKELDTIDKRVIEQLAHDLAVPVSTLLTEEELKRNQKSSSPAAAAAATRQPIHPIKKKPAAAPAQPWNRKFKSKLCSILFGQPTLHFKIGQRVQLLNRPVLTTGTIAYVGKLTTTLSPDTLEKSVTSSKINHDQQQQQQQILGVELDRIVGTNDGSIGGQRYFTTLPNKGIFVKPSEVILA